MSFSHPFRVGRVPAGGRHVRLEASESERQALAASLGIVGVEALTAELDVRPVGPEDFAVAGELRAIVVQTDVVTLDPVRQEVVEPIDLTFHPAAERRGGVAAPGTEETGADERDLYHNGEIDLGQVVSEHLALGLDPYPRAPETAFEGHVEDDSPVGGSPFAALGRLKPDPE